MAFTYTESLASRTLKIMLPIVAMLFSSIALFSCSDPYVYILVDGIYDPTFYNKTDETDIFTVDVGATLTIATVDTEPADSIAHVVRDYTNSEGEKFKTWYTFIFTDPFLASYQYYLSTVEYNYLYLKGYDEDENLKYYLFGKRGNEDESVMSMTYVNFHVARPDKTQIATMTFSLRNPTLMP